MSTRLLIFLLTILLINGMENSDTDIYTFSTDEITKTAEQVITQLTTTQPPYNPEKLLPTLTSKLNLIVGSQYSKKHFLQKIDEITQQNPLIDKEKILQAISLMELLKYKTYCTRTLEELRNTQQECEENIQWAEQLIHNIKKTSQSKKTKKDTKKRHSFLLLRKKEKGI